MTVIAWDGKTLAVDRRAVSSGMQRTATKVWRHGESIIAVCGTLTAGLEMKAWLEAGAKPESLPAPQRTDDYSCVLVLNPSGLWLYEKGPVPMRVESSPFACGSGRDYAMMAMHLGKSAVEAVELTSLFDVYCGNGVDAMTL